LSSLAGNFLPGGSLLAKAAGFASNLLPDAPPLAQKIASQAFEQTGSSPVLTWAQAKDVASGVKSNTLAAGANESEASAAGAVAFTLATTPSTHAPALLESINAQVPVGGANSLSKSDIKVIADGAFTGLKNGAVDAYLDKTADGQATKADAVDSQGQKAMPYILGALLLFIFFKKK
jgi:hypothetical protein